MPPFVHSSIQRKLSLAILATGLSVALLLTLLFVLTEVVSFRAALEQRVATLSAVLAHANRANLSLHLRTASGEVLSSLETTPEIRFAYLLDTHQKLFAHYINPHADHDYLQEDQLRTWLATGQSHSRFTWDSLTVVTPIRHDGEVIATLYIQAGLESLYQRLRWLGMGFAIIVLCALAMTLALADWSHGMITQPVLRLAESMATIARNRSYGRQAVKESDDEIGLLVDVFNGMLRQLDSHTRELEETVLQRTADLESSNRDLTVTVHELEVMRQKAEAASDAKSRFLANMSHEIRTPMVGLLGMADLLRESDLLPRQQELADVLCASGDALLQILNDILDFSKIEAGKLTLVDAPFSLRETLSQVVDLFAERAFAKKVELVLDIAPGVTDGLRGDAGRLRQIFLNLVGNAVKFTEGGHILLRVAQRVGGNPEVPLRLQVIDTGIGIAPADQERIFDSFSQADDGITRTSGGTGLGLAIVRQLVQLMGGDLALRSAPGEGTTFTVDLSFTRGTDQPLRRPLPQLHGRQFLLVIGNIAARQMLERSLTACGARVSHLDTPATLIHDLETALCRNTGVNTLFLDLDLPWDDALALGQSLHNHPLLASIRIIYLASPRLLLQSRQALPAHATVLSKPVKPTQLLAALERAVVASGAHTPEPALDSAPSAKRVLLVEDTDHTQRLVQLILEGEGVQVTIAGSGLEALDAASQQHYDLILMDGQMPGMDGMTATRSLRQRGITTPIIAMTAHAQEETEAQCRAAGMDGYLKKPFKVHQVREVLAQWL